MNSGVHCADTGNGLLVICWMAYRLVTSEKEARTKETEERKNLTRKVDELETEKFTKLENKVDAHIKEDRSQEILNELKHLTGSVSRMADKFERVTAADAEQKAKIETHDLYLRNLNEIVTGHINNHKK